MNSLSNQIHEQFYKMRVGLFKQLNEQVSEQVSNQVRDKEYFQVRVNRAKRVKQNVKL
jgi:hypothetical protein